MLPFGAFCVRFSSATFSRVNDGDFDSKRKLDIKHARENLDRTENCIKISDSRPILPLSTFSQSRESNPYLKRLLVPSHSLLLGRWRDSYHFLLANLYPKTG
jgi:hypothetical protein